MARLSARPVPQLVKTAHWPAPVLGMNAVDPLSMVPPTQATWAVNLIPGERGLIPRSGWQEWCTNVGTGGVRSILSYRSGGGTADKLFACAQDGIYDVTTSSAAPTRVLTFGISDTTSGRGTAVAFTTAAGHFLVYCDESNGAFLYTESSNTWAALSVTGVSASSLVYVVAWKSRLWFVQKGTSLAWYLGFASIGGAATSFDFGQLFRYGGELVGLWDWTVNGGQGPGDYLVAIGRGGDAVVFQGTDPAIASAFAQVGAWFVGLLPAGRRVATAFGGDILVLSTLGVVPLSKLVSGQLLAPDVYETKSIRPVFVSAMQTMSGSYGWEIKQHPTDNYILVNTPGVSGSPQEQFSMSLTTRGWGKLRGLSIACSEVWNGKLYFGTADGRVCVNTGFVDGVTLAGGAAVAQPVDSWLLTAFRAETPNQKMVQLIRPRFVTHGINPAYRALARYDYDLSDVAFGVPAAAASSSAVWDTALWDSGNWSAPWGTSSSTGGSTGIGAAVAIALHMQTKDFASVVGFDLAWTEGGLL